MSSFQARAAEPLNNSTRQQDRPAAALEDGYVEVDGRSFEELCVFASRFGELIWFYGLDHGKEGTWADFFTSDATVALAVMAGVELADMETRYRKAVKDAVTLGHPVHQLVGLRQAGEVLIGLARKVDRWLDMLQRGEPREDSRLARERLEHLIEEDLREPLVTLRGYDLGAAPRMALGERLGFNLDGFLPIWKLDEVRPDSSPFWGKTRSAKIAHATDYLAPLADSVFCGMAELRRFAGGTLAESLEVNDHRPQAALYLAFAKLFQRAQETINGFGRRYIDFYYERVLRGRYRGAQPDRLYLTFALEDDGSSRQVTIPSGTLFSAGQDADRETRLYRTERDMAVTQARLERLRTLRLVRGPKRQPECYLESEIRVPRAEALGSEDDTTGWPTFGPDHRGEESPAVEVTRPATLGLGISSPCLWLEGGQRTICLRFGYVWQSAPATEVFVAADVHHLITESFDGFLTSAEGWQQVDFGAMQSAVSSNSFEIRIQRPPSAPAVAPLPVDKEAGPDGSALPDIDPGVPAVAFRLKQDQYKRLSVLSGLLITHCEIEVNVRSLPHLRVENSEGEVDAEGLFLPFGGVPVLGSQLRIYHREIFVKPLSSLHIGLEWFGLPGDQTTQGESGEKRHGFARYYRRYEVDSNNLNLKPRIDNCSFKGCIRVANPGRWKLEGPPQKKQGQDLFLFRTQKKGDSATQAQEGEGPTPRGVLFPKSEFELQCQELEIDRYYDPAESAVELELSAPAYAFGNSIYGNNVLHAVSTMLVGTSSASELEGACSAGGKALGYPNEPWLPQLARLDVGYKAVATSRLQKDRVRLFRLLPFGGSCSVPSEDTFPFLPPIAEARQDGQLLLGFRGLDTPQILQMLFVMGGDLPNRRAPTVAWSYLDASKGWPAWEPLSPKQVSHDGTGGLTHTGILKLELPALRPSGRLMEPTGLQWIRVVTELDPSGIPATVAILPQATLAAAVLDDRVGSSDTDTATPLPAHSITKPLEDLPAIAQVAQPLASFGGRPPETRRRFETRVAERLRHKERAILPWDYERLVLEHFPKAWQVGVLPAGDASGCRPSGHVTVVVVPGPDGRPGVDATAPKMAPEMLRDIGDFLRRRVGPFVQLEVINPRYVRIEVHAKVVFSDAQGGSQGRQRLNADLCAFLSPWSSGIAHDPSEDQNLMKSQIEEFILARSYVVCLRSLSFVPKSQSEGGDGYPHGCFYTSARVHDIKESSVIDPCATETQATS